MEQNRLLELERDKQKELNQQLNEATQSKLAFFTNVSHDLRTPLTLIAEPVEQVAHASNLTAQQHTLMQIADKNVRILRRLINQILDFRKYENGKLTLNLEEADIKSLIEDWVEAFRPLARKRDIKLTVKAVGEVPASMAIDVEKMERVVFNLVSNAFKYTPDNGHVTVSYGAEGDALVINVADTGKGIPAEDVDKIFERFYQVDKVRPQGSGIGLSLAKAFVELHGGKISVDSEPGEGSEFRVEIPVTHVAAKPLTAVSAEATPSGDIAAELADIEPRRVPVGEGDIDNDFYQRFLAVFTARMGEPELSVDAVAAEMGLGRSQLYRKIKALTNYSPVELMRTLRLRHARTLLTSTDKTISEIAYEVGFSSPAYFTKCYKDAYGETPTDLRDRLA